MPPTTTFTSTSPNQMRRRDESGSRRSTRLSRSIHAQLSHHISGLKTMTTTFQAVYSESRPAEYEAPRLLFWAYAQPSVLRLRDLTTSRGACRAPRANVSRSRLPVGVRALTELGFVAALQAMSARSQKR